jgi:peptide/nickel transport system substrate-binding protein
VDALTTCRAFTRLVRSPSLTALLLFFLVSSISVAGAGIAPAQSPSPTPSDTPLTLRIGTNQEPDSLNPFVGVMSATMQVCSLNYDALVGIDPETNAPQAGESAAGLATSWTTSPDGRIWTFVLRDDATWQDNGQPVTAEDVAFTYDLIRKTEPATFISFVSGIRAVIAIDQTTVQVSCSQPIAGLLYSLANIFILPKHIWEKVPRQRVALDYPNKAPVVGSGPFQIVAFKRGDYVELAANDSYWRGAPKIDRILFEMSTNQWTVVQDLKTGALDAAQSLLDPQLRGLKGVENINTAAYAMNAYDNLVFNCYEPPAGGKSLGNPVLRDWHFRQALQWAIDREKLCTIALLGHGTPGDTILVAGQFRDPDWHWTPPSESAYRFDLAKANRLLDAAGYADADGDGVREYEGEPIRLRLASRVESAFSQSAAKLIASWFKEVGLNTRVQSMESNALSAYIYNSVDGQPAPDFDMFIWGWINTLDPSSGLQYFTTDQIGGLSDTSFSDPEYDRLFRLQERTVDVAKRKTIVDRMQQIVYEQSPQVVLCNTDDMEAWNTGKWTGWQQFPAGTGSVLNTESYLTVQPKTASVEAPSGARGVIWALVAVTAAAVLVIVLLLVRRRRRAHLPEEEQAA